MIRYLKVIILNYLYLFTHHKVIILNYFIHIFRLLILNTT